MAPEYKRRTSLSRGPLNQTHPTLLHDAVCQKENRSIQMVPCTPKDHRDRILHASFSLAARSEEFLSPSRCLLRLPVS
jgi:hypothetical protein